MRPSFSCDTFQPENSPVAGLILSVSLGVLGMDSRPRLRSAGLRLLSGLFSDFHSCLHPFPLSPDCRLPAVWLLGLFPVQG